MSLNELTFYSASVCPYAQRVAITLAHKKIPHNLELLDLSKPRPEWYLKINPVGKVPSIRHNENILVESLLIMDYLEEAFPQTKFLPEDPFLRYKTRSLVQFAENQFIPTFYSLMKAQTEEQQKPNETKLLNQLEYLNTALLELDSISNPPDSSSGFAIGSSFSYLDAVYAPFFLRFCVNEHYRNFYIPESESFARVRRWKDQLIQDYRVLITGLPNDEFIRLYVHYAGHTPTAAAVMFKEPEKTVFQVSYDANGYMSKY